MSKRRMPIGGCPCRYSIQELFTMVCNAKSSLLLNLSDLFQMNFTVQDVWECQGMSPWGMCDEAD